MMKLSEEIPSPKILMVDDRRENLMALRLVLEGVDAELVEAVSGNEALAATLNHDFALALVDVQMPDMDGYELAGLLRSDPRTRHLPIVFLTAAYNEEAQIFKGYEAGAVDYIVKPYNPAVLRSKVSIFLELHSKSVELARKVKTLETTEAALRNSEHQLRTLYSSMTEGLVMHDILYEEGTAVDYVITDVNPAYERLTGLTHEQAVGNKASRLYGTGKPPYLDIYARVAATGAPESFETYFSPMKKYFAVSVFSPARGKFATVFQDISERKKAEEILHRDRETLEQIVRDRTQELLAAREEIEKAKHLSDIGALAATVAHELRNPLAAINMAAYNIKRKTNLSVLDKHLKNIEKKVSESDQIINNLLFYSRLKPPSYENVHVYHVLEASIEMIRKQPRKQIHIVKDVNAIKGVSVEGDGIQIEEVFNNILNNALDAVPPAGGEIRVTAESAEECITITIRDNGSGIDRDNIVKVFDPFFTTKPRGTGLGLSVCRQIINMHKGKIEVKSELGKGTEVIVNLPKKENQ